MSRVLLFMILIGLSGCSAHRVLLSAGDQKLAREVARTDELEKHDFGVALYDPATGEWIYQRKADHYFTPASNTKIITLYTALQFLGDSTIAFEYNTQGDSLFFWGTGDPGLLYASIPNADSSLELLRTHSGSLHYAPRSAIKRFGSGWAWDDFSYAYQVERSTLPLYGNRITFSMPTIDSPLSVTPPYFAQYITVNHATDRVIERLPSANAFEFNPALIEEYPFERSIPFAIDDYLLMEMLRDTLRKPVELAYSYTYPVEPRVVAGTPLDTLYRRLMQQSDNFIAEQLLLQSGLLALDTLSTREIIRHMQDSFLSDLPDPLQWFDGSGLSRYNLFTPRSVVSVLERILDEQGLEFIKDIFPAGGKSGTIEKWYAGQGGPFVWAKTGTLRNKHCLSGFVETAKGRLLIFSFMHQNYIGSSEDAKRAMERILNYIHRKY